MYQWTTLVTIFEICSVLFFVFVFYDRKITACIVRILLRIKQKNSDHLLKIEKGTKEIFVVQLVLRNSAAHVNH